MKFRTGNTDKGKYRSILNVYSVLINNGVLFFATDLHLSIYLNFGQNSLFMAEVILMPRLSDTMTVGIIAPGIKK